MHSISATVNAQCSCGGEPFEASIWSLVRGDEDSPVRQALLSGELNLLQCPHCSQYFHYQTPVVYFDPQMDLLAFILPAAYETERDKWLLKMQNDFALLKKGLLRELKIESAPVVLFGMDKMQAMLAEESDLADESDVIEAIAAQTGIRSRRLPPSFARAHSLPFCLPHAGSVCDRDSVLKAARQMLAANPALAHLKKLCETLSSRNAALPPIP